MHSLTTGIQDNRLSSSKLLLTLSSSALETHLCKIQRCFLLSLESSWLLLVTQAALCSRSAQPSRLGAGPPGVPAEAGGAAGALRARPLPGPGDAERLHRAPSPAPGLRPQAADLLLPQGRPPRLPLARSWLGRREGGRRRRRRRRSGRHLERGRGHHFGCGRSRLSPAPLLPQRG